MPAMYQGKTRMIQFGAKGSPDIIAILNGFFVGIEVKRPGNKQNESQKAFQRNIEGAGGYYILATSPEDLEDKINEIKNDTK